MKIGMISLFLLSSQVSAKASDEWVVVEGDGYYIAQFPEETSEPPEAKEEIQEPVTKENTVNAQPEQCWALIPYPPPLLLTQLLFRLAFPLAWSPKTHKIRRIGRI